MLEDAALRDSEIERLSGIVGEKEMELEDMEDKLRVVSAPIPSTPSSIYNPTKGDAVDEYLAKYINMMQC